MLTSMDALPQPRAAADSEAPLAALSLRCEAAQQGRAGEIDILRSPSGAALARLRGAHSVLSQDARMKAARGGETLLVVFHHFGSGRFSEGTRFEDGDISLCDRAAAWTMCFEDDFELLALEVPRQRLVERLGRGALILPLVLGPTISATAAQTVMRTLAVDFDNLGRSDIVSAEIAIAELVAAALPASARTETSSITQVQAAHFQRVTAAIEARLSQADLSMPDIAGREAMSHRYLQKLFELQHTTFSDYVRNRRLDRARLDLLAPWHDSRSIAEIAFNWGFRDQGHFSRAFRAAFGVTPRAYRSAGQRGANAPRLVRGRPLGKAGRPKPPAAVTPDAPKPMAEMQQGSLHCPPRPTAAHHVTVDSETVHWGYLSRSLAPVLRVAPGAEVVIETLTQHASDDCERMIKGDPGAESVFHWTPDLKKVNRRGAGPLDASIFGRGAGEGFGVHILTGPVHIEGAEPGDVLEVQILDIKPRPSANPDFAGRCFASNASTWWGYQYSDFIDKADRREIVTIFEVEPAGDWARALYSYRWVPQTDPSGVRHDTIDYPGIPVDHSRLAKNFDVMRNIRVPLRPHFGCMSVAPRETGLVDSIPPGSFGGNLDNWRAGKGATLYLPVAVPGALFSVGDGHLAQGDGEIDGTALECSMTGTFRFELHKKGALTKPFLQGLTGPLLETPREFVLHGFSYPDYLRDLGRDAQAEVYQRSSLNRALRSAFRLTRRFLMDAFGLDEDEATTLMSVAVDFGVTQVADGNWGVHATIPKALFR